MANRFLSNVIQKRMLSKSSITQEIQKVAIIGAGLMGSGIAQVAAANNFKVTLIDTTETFTSAGQKRIENSLMRVAKKNFKEDNDAINKYMSNVLGNLKTSTSNEKGIADADLVIEAITENLETKQKLFAALDKTALKTTIFASNTSSFRIEKIAQATDRKDRFGGLHFFNPVPVMKLLEVIRTTQTSEATVLSLLDFGRRMGKHVISCKDTPGFVVNRLLVPYLLEAARMVERGDATPEDIDSAMKLGAGHPMGPIALLDYVGLDTTSFISQGWAKDYPEEQIFKPVPLIDNMVAEKKMGMKSGEGFYKYEKK